MFGRDDYACFVGCGVGLSKVNEGKVFIVVINYHMMKRVLSLFLVIVLLFSLGVVV